MASHVEPGVYLRALIPFWPAVPVLAIAIVVTGLYIGAPPAVAPPAIEHQHSAVSSAAAAGRLALPDAAAPPQTAEGAVVPVQIDIKETVATLDDGVEY